MMTTKLARVLLLALLAGILAAGCGGDDDSGGDGGSAITQASGEGNGAGGDEDSGAEGLPGIASGDDCLQLTSLGATLSQALSAGDTDDLEKQAQFFERFADNTPGEVREDFQTVAEFYSKLTKALADANVQPGEEPDPEALQALQEAATSIDQKELEAATANIEKWVKENCQAE
jgi:hypothetical protein